MCASWRICENEFLLLNPHNALPHQSIVSAFLWMQSLIRLQAEGRWNSSRSYFEPGRLLRVPLFSAVSRRGSFHQVVMGETLAVVLSCSWWAQSTAPLLTQSEDTVLCLCGLRLHLVSLAGGRGRSIRASCFDTAQKRLWLWLLQSEHWPTVCHHKWQGKAADHAASHTQTHQKFKESLITAT